MSLGHFNSGDILNVFSIAFESARADAIGNKVVTVMSNLGYKISDNHIPPFGEIHFLPDLPLPPVCFSAIMAVPSLIDSSVIFNA